MEATAGAGPDARGGQRPDRRDALGDHAAAPAAVGGVSGQQRAERARRRRARWRARRACCAGWATSTRCARARSWSARSRRRPGRRSSPRSWRPSPTSASCSRDRVARVRTAGGGRHRHGHLAHQDRPAAAREQVGRARNDPRRGVAACTSGHSPTSALRRGPVRRQERRAGRADRRGPAVPPSSR